MNNKVTIQGQVVDLEVMDNEYKLLVCSKRLSDSVDTIPVIVPISLIDSNELKLGSFILVKGEYRSQNINHKVKLYVYTEKIRVTEPGDINNILLNGYICKNSLFRETPKGYVITDIILAVNRGDRESDYIPCICWGNDAQFVSSLPVGTHITVAGRVQSRDYKKKIDEVTSKVLTAYEVSVKNLSMGIEIMNKELITIQDCLDMFEKKGISVILIAGQVVEFIKEDK